MLDSNVGPVGRPAPAREEVTAFNQWFLECARMLDGTAVDGIYVAERHGRTDCFAPSALDQLAALAGATHSARLGTYVLMPPLYPPLALLERLAVIDHLSNGRLVCGFGAGFHPEYFAVHERPMSGRGARLDQLLTLMDPWATGPVAMDGAPHYVLPPMQRPRPPLWIGGTSRAAVRRAARYGDAFGVGFTDATLGTLLDRYREECAKARCRPRLVLIQSAWVRHDGDAARSEVVNELGSTLGPEMMLYQEHGQLTARGEITIERMMPYMYVGDSVEVIERVQRDVARWEIDEVILRVHIGIPSKDAVTDCLERIATQVVPGLAT